MSRRPFTTIENVLHQTNSDSATQPRSREESVQELHESVSEPNDNDRNLQVGLSESSSTWPYSTGDDSGLENNEQVDNRYRLIARMLTDLNIPDELPRFTSRNCTDQRLFFDENNNLNYREAVMQFLSENEIISENMIRIIGNYVTFILPYVLRMNLLM